MFVIHHLMVLHLQHEQSNSQVPSLSLTKDTKVSSSSMGCKGKWVFQMHSLKFGYLNALNVNLLLLMSLYSGTVLQAGRSWI
jgi:hypothetical protein